MALRNKTLRLTACRLWSNLARILLVKRKSIDCVLEQRRRILFDSSSDERLEHRSNGALVMKMMISLGCKNVSQQTDAEYSIWPTAAQSLVFGLAMQSKWNVLCGLDEGSQYCECECECKCECE